MSNAMAIPDTTSQTDTTDSQASASGSYGASSNSNLSDALDIVDQALSFGRQKYGLAGQQQPTQQQGVQGGNYGTGQSPQVGGNYGVVQAPPPGGKPNIDAGGYAAAQGFDDGGGVNPETAKAMRWQEDSKYTSEQSTGRPAVQGEQPRPMRPANRPQGFDEGGEVGPTYPEYNYLTQDANYTPPEGTNFQEGSTPNTDEGPNTVRSLQIPPSPEDTPDPTSMLPNVPRSSTGGVDVGPEESTSQEGVDQGGPGLAQSVATATGAPQPNAAQAPGAAAAQDPTGWTQKIFGYITGDRLDPKRASQLEDAANSPNETNPDVRKLNAVRLAAETDGLPGAWSLVQHYRANFDANKAFAAAALRGTQQKPGDLVASVAAANQAFPNLPDGTTVRFTPQGGKVIASVAVAGSDDSLQDIPLTPQQFHTLLTGKEGQFDYLMHHGIGQALSTLTRGPGTTMGTNYQPGVAGMTRDEAEGAGIAAPQQAGTTSTQTPKAGTQAGAQKEPEDEVNYRKFYEEAKRIFPSASQGAQAQKYIADALVASRSQASQEKQAGSKFEQQKELYGIRNQGTMDRTKLQESGRNERAKGRTESELERAILSTNAANARGNDRELVNYIRGQMQRPDFDPDNLAAQGIDIRAFLQRMQGGGQQQGAQGARRPPNVGEVVKGYRFKGGDPKDQNNWEQANQTGAQ